MLFIKTNAFTADKGKKKVKIKWEHVEGASGYKFLLKNDKNRIILRKTILKSKIELHLPEGNYKIRIGTMNKFKKVEAWADWTNLKVIIKNPPEVPQKIEHKKLVSRDGKKMSVKIKWKPPEKGRKNVTSYLIFKINNKKFIKIAQTNKTEYTIKDLDSGKGYKFEVFSVNKHDEESKKSIKIFVNTSKWIKQNLPFFITASYNNLVPVGDFQKLLSYGAGLRLNIAIKRFFSYNIRLGIDTGLWYFISNGNEVDKSIFFPICLSLHYRFIIQQKFTIEPGIFVGGAYNYLTYKDSESGKETIEHLYKPMIGTGLLFTYQFNEKINIEFGMEFITMFETQQPMFLMAFHLGAGFRL